MNRYDVTIWTANGAVYKIAEAVNAYEAAMIALVDEPPFSYVTCVKLKTNP